MPAASNALDNHMPRYFFDGTDTGTTCRDDEGIELVDLEAARREALEALGGSPGTSCLTAITGILQSIFVRIAAPSF